VPLPKLIRYVEQMIWLFSAKAKEQRKTRGTRWLAKATLEDGKLETLEEDKHKI